MAMKKENEINMPGKTGINGRWIKWVFILLFVLLFILSAALISFYFDVNKKTDKSYDDKNANILAEFDKSESSLKTYEDENGRTGVINEDGRVIIDAEWDDIYFLKSDRFIVSDRVNGSVRMGIIDIDENFVSPFVFSSFDSVNSEIIKGYVSEENGYMIFDTSGNSISGTIWDEVTSKDGQVLLSRKNDSFSAVFSGKELSFTSADMVRKADGHLIYVKTSDAGLISSLGNEKLSRIADISSEYLEALIVNNKTKISELTEEQYYSSLAENKIFDNCSVNSITSCEMSAKDDLSYIFSATIDYDYKTDDTEIKNIISRISLNIVKNEQGKFVLKSINKTDL
ncbi:MAG: WG repeat-containing protein [Porcipelethomonas sp.]